ncbi:hypothetical protein QTI17_10135 [Variovorax sp. J31P179]|uniref:hypothetical protein n=1 Tax=Variovorax sp. J31P179 TaxID=3053508 RepID=UPI002577B744|nr:hypothetical protein [Variovorax sp. J31P179]MDM0080949.1 hypothetical protein [Variovorax sp. J31P179]
MTYLEARDQAQLAELDRSITKFIKRRNAYPSPEKRRTVIFFPAGCGSELKRSPLEYSGGTVPDPWHFKTVWLNFHTLVGGALLLRMKRDADGRWVDADNHIVIAGGSIEVFGYTPYDSFARWCARRGIDVFFYGYDWRRPIPEVCEFFATKFLSHFQYRVLHECKVDPLDNVTLIAHCLGGMLVNWILHEHIDVLPKLDKAITVATPFYGYAGQIGRWFVGEPLLNHLGKDAMVRVISSFPALYAVNPLETAIYRANKEAFKNDAYPLPAYPAIDSKSHEEVDPYLPVETSSKFRYPRRKITGFCRKELGVAREVAQRLTEPLDEALSSRFYNIRGILPANQTDTNFTWDWIARDFDPEKDKSPIHLGRRFPGDDTQPGWTTRLLRANTAEQDRCVTDVEAIDTEHLFIMVSRGVLERLAELLGAPPHIKGDDEPDYPQQVASTDRAMAMIALLNGRFRARRADPMSIAVKEIEDYVHSVGYTPLALIEIGRRILVDLQKPPAASRESKGKR